MCEAESGSRGGVLSWLWERLNWVPAPTWVATGLLAVLHGTVRVLRREAADAFPQASAVWIVVVVLLGSHSLRGAASATRGKRARSLLAISYWGAVLGVTVLYLGKLLSPQLCALSLGRLTHGTASPHLPAVVQGIGALTAAELFWMLPILDAALSPGESTRTARVLVYVLFATLAILTAWVLGSFLWVMTQP